MFNSKFATNAVVDNSALTILAEVIHRTENCLQYNHPYKYVMQSHACQLEVTRRKPKIRAFQPHIFVEKVVQDFKKFCRYIQHVDI